MFEFHIDKADHGVFFNLDGCCARVFKNSTIAVFTLNADQLTLFTFSCVSKEPDITQPVINKYSGGGEICIYNRSVFS